MQAAVRVDPEDMAIFTNHWNQKMRKNYRETLSRAKTSGKKPGWMGDDIWAGFQQHWESEAFKVSYNVTIFLHLNWLNYFN